MVDVMDRVGVWGGLKIEIRNLARDQSRDSVSTRLVRDADEGCLGLGLG
jgi:hypothetical protein